MRDRERLEDTERKGWIVCVNDTQAVTEPGESKSEIKRARERKSERA